MNLIGSFLAAVQLASPFADHMVLQRESGRDMEDAKFALSLKQRPGGKARLVRFAEADDVIRNKLPNGDDEFTFTYRDSAAPVRAARVTLRRDAEGEDSQRCHIGEGRAPARPHRLAEVRNLRGRDGRNRVSVQKRMDEGLGRGQRWSAAASRALGAARRARERHGQAAARHGRMEGTSARHRPRPARSSTH